MAEGHAYGYTLFCLSRRLFVLVACGVMAVLCYVQLFKWILGSRFWERIIAPDAASEVGGSLCRGVECYAYFTCYGMKDATYHIREPLVTLAGALVLPYGLHGAHHNYRPHLHVLSYFLIISALLHLACIILDWRYIQNCGSYPSNIIQQTIINWMPPSPVTNAAQDVLRQMRVFHVEAVAAATYNFNVQVWYYAWAGAITAFLALFAWEAFALGELAERGPLGLGVHYGLGQWDEFLNHDALRRCKSQTIRSKFIEDAILPPSGTAAAVGYGTMSEQLVPIQVLLKDPESDDDDEDEESALEAREGLVTVQEGREF